MKGLTTVAYTDTCSQCTVTAGCLSVKNSMKIVNLLYFLLYVFVGLTPNKGLVIAVDLLGTSGLLLSTSLTL